MGPPASVRIVQVQMERRPDTQAYLTLHGAFAFIVGLWGSGQGEVYFCYQSWLVQSTATTHKNDVAEDAETDLSKRTSRPGSRRPTFKNAVNLSI